MVGEITAQSLVRRVPLWFAPAIVQFLTRAECRDMTLFGPLLVVSMMSISPVEGQTPVPTIQKAGQTPQLRDVSKILSREEGRMFSTCCRGCERHRE